MGEQREDPEDALRRKAKELERLKEFVDQTTFAGDEREAADELSTVDQHPADVADIHLQREMDQSIRRILEREAQQVQAALERQRTGQYGICENCGRPIDPERLRARPEATLCIDCQRERERQAARHGA